MYLARARQYRQMANAASRCSPLMALERSNNANIRESRVTLASALDVTLPSIPGGGVDSFLYSAAHNFLRAYLGRENRGGKPGSGATAPCEVN